MRSLAKGRGQQSKSGLFYYRFISTPLEQSGPSEINGNFATNFHEALISLPASSKTACYISCTFLCIYLLDPTQTQKRSSSSAVFHFCWSLLHFDSFPVCHSRVSCLSTMYHTRLPVLLALCVPKKKTKKPKKT